MSKVLLLYYEINPLFTCRPQTDKDSVDFSRLLTLDYQREWLEERETKQQQFLRKAKVTEPAYTVEHMNQGHFGDNINSAVVSFVERLSSSQRFKM